MYQALYRKWRPKIFEDVLGQSHITGTLKNQILNSKLSHAYLFSGTRGTGKTSTAKILARAVNCQSPIDGNPCNECYACKAALSGSAVDIIEMDAASNNKVEDARLIRDEVIYTPAEFKYKVYIIDEAHMLTSNAFNALLKTLEEPPSHIIFIFATTEPQKFPATILSRCQRFDFKRITPFDISRRIKQILLSEECEISDEALMLVVRVADGSMRDALSLLDQCVSLSGKKIDAKTVSEIAGVSDPEFIYKFANAVISGDVSSSMRFIKEAYDKGFDLSYACDELLSFFRNVMIAKTLDSHKAVCEILEITEGEAEIVFKTAENVSLERIIRYIDMIENAINSRMFLGNSRLSLEIAVAGMTKKISVDEPQGMLEKVMELDNRVRKLENGSVAFPVSKKESAVINEEPHEEKTDVISEEIKAESQIQPEDEEEYCYTDENSDFPMFEESFNPEDIIPNENDGGEVKNSWGDALIVASKNSLPGFDKIMSSTKASFNESVIDIYFDSESFLKIAQMNKFDENIKKAYKTICGIDVLIKMRVKTDDMNEEADNYSTLLGKLKNVDNVEYL